MGVSCASKEAAGENSANQKEIFTALTHSTNKHRRPRWGVELELAACGAVPGAKSVEFDAKQALWVRWRSAERFSNVCRRRASVSFSIFVKSTRA
jgi:hypothetical protein